MSSEGPPSGAPPAPADASASPPPPAPAPADASASAPPASAPPPASVASVAPPPPVVLRGPVLVATDARIDVDDVPACDGLSLETKGQRVLVLGAPRALYEAAAGLRPVARGEVTVQGVPAAEAARARAVAGAPLSPPLPPRWTALEYVTWSARLAGLSKADAASAAKVAVGKLQLGPVASDPIVRLVAHARRATVVAAALASLAPDDARTIVLEDPTGALPEETARTFSDVLVKALEGVAWIVFAPRMPLTSPLALAADEALVVSGSRVSAQGAPAELGSAVRRFALRVHGPVDQLTSKLTERGARAEVDGARLVVDLGEALSTSELLAISVDAGVTVVELHPIARALA